MKKTLFLFMLLFIILSSCLINAYATDDVFKNIKSLEPTKAEAVISVDSKGIIDKNALSVSFNEVCGKVKSYQILSLSNCSKQIPIIENKEVCEKYDNKSTGKTNDVCSVQSFINGFKYEYYACYKEISDLKAVVSDYKIKADIAPAKCSDGSFGWKVDFIPSFSISDQILEQKAWAWWNVSYSQRLPINCSLVSDGTPILINGSKGFKIDGYNQLVWIKCNNTAVNLSVYYNNYSSYTIAHDSGVVAFEVERGNISSNNPTSVWDGNYTAVYHQNSINSLDSTSNGNTAVSSGSPLTTNTIIGSTTKLNSSGSQYQNLSNESQFDFTNSTSFEALLIPGTQTVAYAGIMSKQGLDPESGFFIDRDNADATHYRFGYGVGGTFSIAATTYNLINGELNYLGFSKAGSNVSLFVNGTRITSEALGSGVIGTNNFNMRIGTAGDPTIGNRYWNGSIDEVRFSNIKRNDSYFSQIQNNFINNYGYGNVLNNISGISCNENWSASFESCLINDTKLKIYTDLNVCNTTASLPADNGTSESCNYCTEDIVSSSTECLNGYTSTNYTDNNFLYCCYITGLSSDCSILYPPYDEGIRENCTTPTDDVVCDDSNFSTDFSCELDTAPILHEKMNIVCEMPDSDRYCCVVNLLQNNTLLATTPEYREASDSLFNLKGQGETRECFNPSTRMMNGYYTPKNLRTDTPFTIQVSCTSDNVSIKSEYCLTPVYDKPDAVVNRMVWARQNIVYIILVFIGFLLVVGLIAYVRRKI